jgi:hypothetical protein
MGYQLVGVGASILWTGGWPRPVMAVGDSITWTARGPLRDVVDAKVVARDATRLTDPWFPADGSRFGRLLPNPPSSWLN